MKKMTGLILSLVLFLFSFPSVVYAKDKIPIMGNEKLDIKYTEKLNVPSNGEINIKIDSTQPTPVLTPLPQIPIEFQKIIDNAKPDEILDISVALDWDSKILVDDFIKQYPELAKEISIKKESAFRFNAKANCTQIEILKNMKEVMRITPPSKARIDLCSNKKLAMWAY